MMFNRCRHQWKEVKRTFSQPDTGDVEEVMGAQLAKEIWFGVTVVELRCDECGDIKFERVVGQA